MVDRAFSDPELAAVYDLLHPPAEREDFRFYLPLVMAATSVLDVGCGTGALLRMARQAGHAGRLCGLDPAEAMLEEARSGARIECVRGDLGSQGDAPEDWRGAFDLVVMTGHAFQVLVDDAELSVALAAVRVLLTERGRFAFETRNPSFRAWEQWVPENAVEVTDAAGAVVRMEHAVDLPVSGELVRFTTTFTSTRWEGPRKSRSTLRFLRAEALVSLLGEAGLEVEQQLGDWNGDALGDASPEIITIARPAV